MPLNGQVLTALDTLAAWYARTFGECKPEWFVLPYGKPLRKDRPEV